MKDEKELRDVMDKFTIIYKTFENNKKDEIISQAIRDCLWWTLDIGISSPLDWGMESKEISYGDLLQKK